MRTYLSAAVWIVCLGSAAAQTIAPLPQQQVSPAQAAAASKAANEAAATQQAKTLPPQDEPVVLDSVVAVINGDVLLESDVETERRLNELDLVPSDQNTNADAARRLITQTLILQQMKEEGQPDLGITNADVNKVVKQLQDESAGCKPNRCDTEAGWARYLETLQLTPEAVASHWRKRLTILAYLNLRFRSGIRVPESQVRSYYQETLVPQFTAKHMQPPAFAAVKHRISELLVQQQVSKQIDAWESALRQQGTIRILVPAYGDSNTNGEMDSSFPGGL